MLNVRLSHNKLNIQCNEGTCSSVYLIFHTARHSTVKLSHHALWHMMFTFNIKRLESKEKLKLVRHCVLL